MKIKELLSILTVVLVVSLLFPTNVFAQAPTAPTGLTATLVRATQVGLNWIDNAVNEAGFRIERATDAAFASFVVLLAGANTNSGASTSSRTGSTTNQPVACGRYYSCCHRNHRVGSLFPSPAIYN